MDCQCKICRLPRSIVERVVCVLFRDIVMSSYGADIVRVWTVRSG